MTENWTLTKQYRFEAAHHLPAHDGKCRRIHGHSWVLVVQLKSGVLYDEGPKQGMVCDYGDMSAVIEPWVDEYLDHRDLNETTGLLNPTSEEIARWAFHQLDARLPGLEAITVWETCTSECRYARD
jgi:6-pyruvoyltetrahydropterin/6-carboxytetrahydropterin synthase